MVSVPKSGYPSFEDRFPSGETVFYLLLLCGDISTNPGPIQHPCTVCSGSVRSNHCALQCDNCNFWSHARCVGVDASFYRKLQLKGDFCWQCPSCLFSVLPGTEVCIDEPQSPISCVDNAIPSTVDVLERAFSGIQIVHHNIQGLHSKTDELLEWFQLCNGKDVIFCFSEVWINPDSPPFDVPGFHKMISPFHGRPNKQSFLPGSCMFVSNTLSTVRNAFCRDIEDSCKLLNVTCCLISCKHSYLAVVSLYRSPSTSPSDCLQEIRMFSQLLSFTKHIIIVGDFNLDLLQSSKVQCDYADILSDFQCSQHVTAPSRVTASSSTLIDHVLSTPSLSVTRFCQSVGLSDHRCQIIEVDIPVNRSTKCSVTVRSFRKCPWNEVRESLHTAPWQVMDIYDDVNEMWEFFITILLHCLDQYAPRHTVVCKHSHRPTPWLTPALSSAIKQKKQAKRRADSTANDADIALYKKLKNQLKCHVREAKLGYLKQLLLQTRNNPHSAADLWSGVNNIIGRYRARKNNTINTTLSLDSINDFFRTIAISTSHEPASNFIDSTNSGDTPTFHFQIISSSAVLSLLNKLDVRKSVGPDGISARFLKEVAEPIAAPLTKLYNRSLETGIIPNQWKCSNVTPVHKGGSCDNPGNFRPISVVPVVAKVFEKIVASQLDTYFEDRQLLSIYQGAYRHGKSTEQLLLLAVDTIVRALDRRNIACVAFLDLRKAFDSLDHKILLQRLSKLGVHGIEIAWFISYLSDRVQRVKHNGAYSEWGTVGGGIPQGSALGPLLFLVYMNDMPSQVHNGKLLQYADDTALICTGGDYCEVHNHVTTDLQHISNWITSSKMQLNIAKSSVMWFKPKSSNHNIHIPPVYINNTPLQRVTTQKYLGVIFDDKLQWISHVSTVCKKVSFYLFWINYHRKCLSSLILKMLLDSLAFSRINYALPVWGPAISKLAVSRLQRLQNRAVRITKSLSKYDHVSHHRKTLNWLSVASLIQYRSLCSMFHQYHPSHAVILDPPIVFGPQHMYCTRCHEHFANLDRCRLSFTQNFFRYRASHWWNQLPDHVVSSTPNQFRSTVHANLLHHD